MKKCYWLLILLLTACNCSVPAQTTEEIHPWDTQDSVFFKTLLPKGKNLLQIANYFLKKPYESATLEQGDDFYPLVNLHAFDCTTLVENVLALYEMETVSFKDFEKNLQKIRYREGQAQGYTSRLHYFSDWIRDNIQKGILVEITQQAGGVQKCKEINYISKHWDYYKSIKTATQRNEIQKLEKQLSKVAFYEIEKDKVVGAECFMRDGDIVAITTNIQGLDVVHVGIAEVNRQNGRVHLLHASSQYEKVIRSKKTLADYLAQISTHAGIRILRVKK